MNTARPNPECLAPNTPQRWTHRATPATRHAIAVNPGARTIAAPTTNDPEAVALRRFATLRAAMEPTHPAEHAREIGTILRQAGATPETAEAAARALDLWRIANHARHHALANIDAIRDPALTHRATAAAIAGAHHEMIVTYIEAQATGESRAVALAIAKAAPEMREPLAKFRANAQRILRKSCEPQRDAYAYTHARTQATDDPTTNAHIDNAVSRHAWRTDVSLCHALAQLFTQTAPEPNEDDAPDEPGTNDHHTTPDPAELWQPLRVWRGRMNTPHLGMMARSSRRRTQTGRTIADPRRLYTDPDRRAFYRRSRDNGGTVVLDCSGSMSLTLADVESILAAATGATVYAYNYTHPTAPTLFLLAENGRAVSGLPSALRAGGSNGVDAPALRYAAERHNPRDPFVWVSDANYNGKHRGSADQYLGTDLAEVLTATRAAHCETVHDAIVMLDRISRGGHANPHALPYTVQRANSPDLRRRFPQIFPTTHLGKYAR